MDYSEKQLEQIRRLAGELTPASEISVLLDLPSEDQFLLDIGLHGHPARKAFLGGLAATANDLRRKNLQLAAACAPSAMEQCCAYITRMIQDL